MDSMTEAEVKYEINGTGPGPGSGSSDPLETSTVHTAESDAVTSVHESEHSIVQLTIPAAVAGVANEVAQVQSVIQPNQQSVIQSATNVQPVHIATKSNVILVSGKANSVIQTAQGSLQAVQVDYVVESSDESLSNDEIDDTSPKKRRDILTRRPSYRKILNDLGGGEIAVIPASAIQIGSQSDGSLHTLNINAAGGGNTIVQYQGSDSQFFMPGGPVLAEDQARKRELRLMKNREAARECRRKKKEYIKCLENRVAVLENQNKALIDELKSLKELYCQQKVE